MRRLLWSSVMAIVCAVAPVAGQTTSGGSVRGQVEDEQGGALSGVKIAATGDALSVTYVATTDEHGSYRLTDLPPGTYRIVVALEGFTTLVREPVVVRAGMTVGLGLQLKVGAVADTVEVIGDTPLLERTLSSQTVNIDGELQRALPLSPRRHWTDFLMLTPGVAAHNLGSHLMIYYAHGSGFDSQVSLLDGAEVSPASQNIASTVNVSAEALADVQVTTVGATAATPLGAGTVLNAVTKSGTNALTGSAALTWQDMRWNANNRPGGTSTQSAIVQPDLSVGGPILRDRAWFFGSYRHNRYRESLDRTPLQLGALSALSPGFAPFDRRNVSNFYFAKGSTLLAPNHRLQGFYKYDVNPTDAGTAETAAIYSRSIFGGHTGSVQLNSLIADKIVLKATATLNRTTTSVEVARLDVPRRSVFQTTNLVSGRLQGVAQLAILDNISVFNDSPGQRAVASADLTLLEPAGLNGHEAQVGVYWQRLDLDRETRYVNNGFALEELVLRNPADLTGGIVPFHRQIFDSDRAVTQDVDANDFAGYVQDIWRLRSAATLTAGVRVDRISQRDNLFGLRLQQSTEISPSVGANVAIPGDSKALVHVTWARRHEGVPGTIVPVGSNAIGFRDMYDLNLDGVFETTFVTPGATALLPDRRFDPGRHQPYVDDLAAGYQRQIGGTTTVDATYIHRTFKDRTAYVEINGIYTDNMFSGYRNPALSDIALVTNNTWNRQVYDALEARASHSTDTVQLLASYTRQWRRLDGMWQPNDPAAIVQPDAFANSKGVGYSRGATSEANSLSGTSMAQYLGPTSQWRDHVVNMGASLRGPWHLLFSTNYNFASGPWSGPVVTRLAAPDPAFGSPTVTLSTGRVVSNPLATTLRFPGRDRTEGQFALPDLHVWSIRVGRNTTVRGAKLETSVNVQNVLNGDSDQSLATGGNQLFSQNYKTFVARQAPRSAQLLLRVLF